MKIGFTTSVALHAAVLGFGLVTLSSPRPLEMSSGESFPVEIVPFEEISTSVIGEREAPAAETPAPTPTSRPEPVEDAENVGENTVDLDTPPTPDPSPREVEAAAAPAAEPEPEPAPVEETEVEAESEPEPAPATEVAPEPQEQQDVAPDPAPESAVAEAPEPDDASGLPEQAPRPQARPQPPQAQTAQTPERREPERRPEPEPATTADRSQDSDFDADQIAALLNQQEASGGGAQRSEQEAALGGRQTTGAQLSQSEIDGLRGQIQRCWNVPAGAMDAENLRVSIQMRLNRNGEVEGSPQIVGGAGAGAERIAAEAGRRAVLRCQPYNLPADRYDAWADVIVHFDPRDMF